MLIKHSFIYLAARGMPGIITFLAIACYTRLLPPEAYGTYALALAWATLGNAAMFQWIRAGLSRYLSSYQGTMATFLYTVAAGFIILVGSTALLAVFGMVWLGVHKTSVAVVLLGLLMMWSLAWYELVLEIERAQLRPFRYGKLALCKSVISLLLGAALIYLGQGAVGLLIGTVAGMIIPLLIFYGKEWRTLWGNRVDWRLFRLFLAYGAPLTVSYTLEFIINSSDRLFLAWFVSKGAAGVYSVGYDLARQTLGLVMMIINIAAFPLAVRAMRDEGMAGAKQQLMQNGTIILLVSLPAAAALSLLAPNVAFIFLGENFREEAARLIPLIALATFLIGLKTYHFDRGFQLGKNTKLQMGVALPAAIVNLGLNVWWIPVWGLMGAAYSTIISYVVALFLSIILGRRIFTVPFPVEDACKIALSALVMLIVLWPLSYYHGVASLIVQVVTGASVYFLAAAMMNAAGLRTKGLLLYRFLFKKYQR